MSDIKYEVEPSVSEDSLNELFSIAWDNFEPRKFGPTLSQSLTYICAFTGARLIGFVNVAWDGGSHGFILDVTVHRDFQRRGIGTELMGHAAKISAKRGVQWLHVDFEPYLERFYQDCGYRHTEAGLLNLRPS